MILQETQELLVLISIRKPPKAKTEGEIEAFLGIRSLPNKSFGQALCGLNKDRRIQSHERLGR